MQLYHITGKRFQPFDSRFGGGWGGSGTKTKIFRFLSFIELMRRSLSVRGALERPIRNIHINVLLYD